MMYRQNYRPDIDGLRCISVLAVMLFHFNIAPFSGGFVGVDIFFVISGYLITKQIVEELVEGRFSFANFYARRIRRIVPVMLFTLASVFILAALLFSPTNLRLASRDVLASLVAFSNFNFWRDSHEYFSPAAMQIPLLHFWSLSVEEQFYAIWPAALLLTARSGRQATIILFVIGVSVLSLLLCQYWIHRDASAVFYLMPFRAFEFGIGAAIVYLEQIRNEKSGAICEVLFAVGIGMIGYSILSFDSHTAFLPGFASLAPTIGASLVIFSGRESRLAGVLRLRLVVGIGLISYSLYLCHWPMFVFGHYVLGGMLDSVAAKYSLVAAAVLVASVMYWCVERPFRIRRGTGSGQPFKPYIAAAVFSLLIAVPAIAAYHQKGWPGRISDERQEISQRQAFGYSPCKFGANQPCEFGDRRGRLALQVLGDSYGQHYVAGLHKLLSRLKLRGQAFTAGGCSVLPGVWRVGRKEDAGCDKSRADFYRAIKSGNVPLLINQSWTSYTGSASNRIGSIHDGLEKLIAELGGERRILIIGEQVFSKCAIEQYRLELGPLGSMRFPCTAKVSADAQRARSQPFNEMLRELQRSHPNQIALLFAEDYLCDKSCKVEDHGISLYRDRGHFTVAGSEFVVSSASKLIEGFLQLEQER
jgi:peptidoglycan/LPS O-acetylase OafA/YrhL